MCTLNALTWRDLLRDKIVIINLKIIIFIIDTTIIIIFNYFIIITHNNHRSTVGVTKTIVYTILFVEWCT